MDQLKSMKVFVRVAQRTSFAAAARDLRLSTAAVTKHIAALEKRVGARLFDRTTRTVHLTEAGRVYLERGLECVAAFEAADGAIGALGQAPRGVLRVTAPVEFGHTFLTLHIAAFMAKHPEVSVDLHLSNRVVDLVEEGIDVGVRVALSLDASYVARPIATTRLFVCGAPAYFKKHGRPTTPAELAAHRNVIFTEPALRDELVFTKGRETQRVKVPGVFTSNNGDALRVAACEGIGLAMMPSFLAYHDVLAGRLQPALLDWSMTALRVYVVYPHRRFLAPKVRAFVDSLVSSYGTDAESDPWWAPMVAERRR